jgi:MFS family permease
MGVYLRILRTPSIAALVAATVILRLPFAINGLAVVLYMRETTGSFTAAGLVAGALALGAAIGAPLSGRLIDRRGASWLLLVASVHAGSVLAVWGLGAAGAPAAVVALPALLAGTAAPPAGALLRSRYPQLLGDPELVHGAYALDSVMIELSFITGPLITAVLVALAGPQYALLASAILVVSGTALFLSRLPAEHGRAAEVAHTGRLGPLADPAIRMVALTTLPVGFCLGAIEVALPAFTHDQGDPALAGILLAIWSAASGAGGLLFGARGARGGMVDTFLRFALVFPLACIPLVVASSSAAMVPLVILAGLPIAPLIASRNLLVGHLAPDGTGAESFTWLVTALVTGLAAGNAVGGALSQGVSWQSAVVAGCAIAFGGAALAYGFRGVLHPRFATG